MSYMQSNSRRHSLLEVTQTSKWKPRSVSTSMADVPNTYLSNGIVTRRNSTATPCNTPCFTSPSMAFTTQFSYDSPIQILTSNSCSFLSPRAIKKYKRSCRCSPRNLPHSCKMVLILVFFAIASGLFIYRSINERQNVSVLGARQECGEDYLECENLDDELVHDHPSLQRFIRSVKQPTHYHVLTSELDDAEVQADNEQQILSQFLQEEEEEKSETDNLEGTHLELTTEEELLKSASEPAYKRQIFKVQGQYTEDLEQKQQDAVHTEDAIQDGGSLLHHYYQGENIHGEHGSQMKQDLETKSPDGQYNMQDHDSEIGAIQGELMHRIPQRNYAEQGIREQQTSQNFEYHEQQRNSEQEWRQAEEALHRQESANSGGIPQRMHNQPRPAKPQQRRRNVEPVEARLRRPQDSRTLPQQMARKPRQGPMKPGPRDAGQREQRFGRGQERGAGRGYYSQRLPPGVNPSRYSLSEL